MKKFLFIFLSISVFITSISPRLFDFYYYEKSAEELCGMLSPVEFSSEQINLLLTCIEYNEPNVQIYGKEIEEFQGFDDPICKTYRKWLCDFIEKAEEFLKWFVNSEELNLHKKTWLSSNYTQKELDQLKQSLLNDDESCTFFNSLIINEHKAHARAALRYLTLMQNLPCTIL